MATPRKSKSGYWNVTLNRPFPIPGFTYRPGITHRVNDKVLEQMKAVEGLIDSAGPSD
ncbi:MAG: hypothetical protein PHE36_09295 [Novosphingobium sp.]|nr:hypothetical protein [Novosphingobium sp.]